MPQVDDWMMVPIDQVNGVFSIVEKLETWPPLHDVWSQLYDPDQGFGERMMEFFSPSSEAATTERNYEIYVELFVDAEKDIAIEVNDGQLTVTGGKCVGKNKSYYFFRTGLRYI